MNAANQSISDFLDYYCKLKASPKYAVLITGPWGSGKTHLVKGYFAENADVKHLYVSLYSISDVSDIEAAFFSQLHPILSSKGMKVAAAIAKGLLKNAKIDLDLSSGGSVSTTAEGAEPTLPKFLLDARDRILVFDDLERARLPIKEVLGYINTFVEHGDSKVILIANELEIEELDGAKEYGRTKEKLVGKTFEVQADLSEAFDEFVASIENEDIRDLYRNKAEDIENIFNQSKTDNLRTLQRTLWDFERLTRAMTPAHRKNADVLSAILGPYFALSFEMKANRVCFRDLKSLDSPDFSWLLQKDKKSKQREIVERYPEVQFSQSIIGMDIIGDALFRSVIDADLIKRRIDRSRLFSTVQDEPPWRALWFSMTRSEEDAQRSLADVERQFQERSFTDLGVVLHVFGLRLWASRIGAIPKSQEEIIKECKEYADDLYAAGKLLPQPGLRDALGNDTESYDGLGYMDREKPEFQEVSSYLYSKEQQAIRDGYPKKAQELMQLMLEDPESYFHRLCYTNRNENVYADIPILTFISPTEFVEQVMNLHYEARRTVLMTFAQRYQFSQASPALADEFTWASTVEGIFRERAARLSPIGSYSLIGLIDRYLHTPIEFARKQVEERIQALDDNRSGEETTL